MPNPNRSAGMKEERLVTSGVPRGTEGKYKLGALARASTVWLGAGGLVFGLLFACGIAAINLPSRAPLLQSRTSMRADYGIWSPMLFARLDPGRLLELARELGVGSGFPGGIGKVRTTPIATGSPTQSVSATPTSSAGTSTPGWQGTYAPSSTPANNGGGLVASATASATPSNTEAPTSTASPTETSTPTDTPTDTATPIPSDTPVPTATLTPNPTPTPCDPSPPGCEPDLGPPDGGYSAVPGGTAIVLDLGLNPVVADGDPDPDLVYYERDASGQIFLDLVIVEIGMTSDGEWFVVFNWGDQSVDANTNVAGYAADGEDANEVIPSSDLYGTPPYTTGITIDVDAVVSTPGVYGWVRITGPTPDLGAGDWAEVDAVEVLPTPMPTP